MIDPAKTQYCTTATTNTAMPSINDMLVIMKELDQHNKTIRNNRKLSIEECVCKNCGYKATLKGTEYSNTILICPCLLKELRKVCVESPKIHTDHNELLGFRIEVDHTKQPVNIKD